MSGSGYTIASRQEKIDALLDVARFNPKFTLLIIGLGLVAAVLGEVGLSFIPPIVETVQAEDSVAQADGLMTAFVTVYQALGIPFTLGFVVVTVAVVMMAWYTMSFIVDWFREALRTHYIRDLQIRARECVRGLQRRQADCLGVVRNSKISMMNVGHRPTNLRAGDAREQLTRTFDSRTT